MSGVEVGFTILVFMFAGLVFIGGILAEIDKHEGGKMSDRPKVEREEISPGCIYPQQVAVWTDELDKLESYCDKLEEKIAAFEDLEIAHQTLRRINEEFNVKNSRLEADRRELVEALRESNFLLYNGEIYFHELTGKTLKSVTSNNEEIIARMGERDERFS